MLRLPAGALRLSLTTTRSCSRIQRSHYSNRPSAPPSTPSSRSTSSQKTRQRTRYTREAAPVILAENRCAQVTTWDLLKNLAEAYALVRAVEKKYGPVENVAFRKDSDSPSTYQTRVQITFRNIESFNRLPILPEALHIRGPKVQPKRPGGIGLDEIQPFITGDVEFLTADQVSEIGREKRTIDFWIQRADSAYFSSSPFRQPPIYEKQRKAIGSKMLKWGGFHEMRLIDSTRPITNEDLTKETIDHVYMRRTLRDWAKHCGELNPFELHPEETTKPVSLESEVIEDEEKPETEQCLDDWFSDVQQPKAVRDPMEQVLEMEDIQVARSASVEPQGVNDSQLKQSTSLETTARETPSTLSLESISFTMLPSKQLDPSQAASSEPEHTLSSSTSSPSTTPFLPTSSTEPESDTSQSSSQSSSQSFDSVVFPPVPPASSPEEPRAEVSRTAAEAEIQGTQRLDDLEPLSDESSEKPDTHHDRARETEAKVKLEGIEDADAENPRLEHDSRFNGLYDRLQGIIKGS